MLTCRAQLKYQFPKAQSRKTYYIFRSRTRSLCDQYVCIKRKQSIYTDSAVSEIAACGLFTTALQTHWRSCFNVVALAVACGDELGIAGCRSENHLWLQVFAKVGLLLSSTMNKAYIIFYNGRALKEHQ